MEKRILILLSMMFMIGGCSSTNESNTSNHKTSGHQSDETTQIVKEKEDTTIKNEDIPDFDGEIYARVMNDNEPYFNDDDLEVEEDYFSLSDLDDLDRAGSAICVCSKDTVSDEERESLDDYDPSGFQTTMYELIDGYYLYNRSHLLMFKACGGTKTDVIENLITGTEYFNTSKQEGMLKYEEALLDYIENTDDHVLYRVTPVYKGDDLVPKGVLMEAKSLDTDDFEFCVFIYNEEPGYYIDHSTGDSYSLEEGEEEITSLDDYYNDTEDTQEEPIINTDTTTYVINTNTGVFHYEWCDSVNQMKEKNKKVVENTTREEVIDMGYHPCHNCNP